MTRREKLDRFYARWLLQRRRAGHGLVKVSTDDQPRPEFVDAETGESTTSAVIDGFRYYTSENAERIVDRFAGAFKHADWSEIENAARIGRVK